MRCSICGAKLRKDGDICTNCYKKLQEEKELENDKNVAFEVKRKYGIAYEITKYTWVFIILIISAIGCFAAGNILAGFLCLLILIVVIGFLLFFDKRLAIATKAVFYETKAIYTFKFLFFDTEKVVKYSNINDIRCYKTFSQKRFGYGDLCIYASGGILGANLINGFQIKNVENADETMKNIIELVAESTIKPKK